MTSLGGVLMVVAAAWCAAVRAEIPTPGAAAFTTDVTDEASVARGYALDLVEADGVYRIGVAATCDRAARALAVWLYFRPFPASKPLQTAVRTADGSIERFGPVVLTEHGALLGFHSPRLTEPDDVARFLEAAFTTGMLVSNGHMSWWHRGVAGGQRGGTAGADGVRRPAGPVGGMRQQHVIRCGRSVPGGGWRRVAWV